VVISHGFWQRRFAADPSAVGQSVRLDGELHTIVGVMPRGFLFAPFWATEAELWAPLSHVGRPTDRQHNSLRVFARLAPGVSVPRAQADVDAVTTRLEADFPATNRDVRVVPLKERVVGETRLAFVVFMVGVLLVLVIACANVAHILLARAATRRREVAVRLALGATRGQIVRQFLVESLLLAVAAGAAGLAVAVAGVRALVALAPPDLPRTGDIRIDGVVLAFTTVAAVAAGIGFGLAPALQAARPVPGEHLAGGRGASADRRQASVRELLMASEVALSLVLVAGAGLMVRSLSALQSLDPGFTSAGVLSFTASVLGTPQAEPARRPLFYTELTERLAALPGAASVSAINHLPLDGDLWTRGFAIEGRPAARPGEGPAAIYRSTLPDYFATMGVPVRRGRDFTWQDTAGTPGVVILSENLARRHWPGEDALGQRLVVGQSPSPGEARWLTVVGVVEDVARDSWEGGRGEELYVPFLQTADYLESTSPPYTYLTYVLRARGSDPAALMPQARIVVASMDRGVAVSDVTTLDAVVSRALARPRFQSTLLTLCAAVALMLAAAGIYGVVSYAVARRSREIGLRMALGAQQGEVRRMVVRQSFRHVAIGVAVGLAGAVALTRLMASLLYGVRPGDPATFAAATLLLAAVALLASAVPAWRASRIEPVVALREE
jgi:putative ABC transport system permease protein